MNEREPNEPLLFEIVFTWNVSFEVIGMREPKSHHNFRLFYLLVSVLFSIFLIFNNDTFALFAFNNYSSHEFVIYVVWTEKKQYYVSAF